jgi:Carboxypeptidase regulatory-like domain/TonB dependent receptor-like, beta-barrel
MQRPPVSVVVGFVLSLLFSVSAFGQAVSELNGTVVDSSQAVLPGVTITMTEETTGFTRNIVSNEVGRFVAIAVTPGRYTIKAELSGFQPQTRTGVTIAVGQAVTLNFTLPVGGLQDQVTVTGEAPLIEPTQTQIGTNLSQTDIENLPMQGREQFSLMALVPGLTPALQPGSFEGSAYNANGRESGSNLYLVDGQYNKDDRTGTFPQSRITVDSMAEYQVLTHEYGAEYGGASGVIVNAITKSGTNQLHGRGFYFLQDSKLNAINYFDKINGDEKPDSGTKSMGGNIGGPIVKNKAFWFFNYEYTHSRDAVHLSFPPAAAPVATSFSDVYNVHLYNYFVRGDYQFSPSNTVHGSFIYGPNDGYGENAEAERFTKQGFRYELAAPEALASFSWTSILNNKMVNEVKVGTVKENLWIGDRSTFNDKGKDIPWNLDTHEWTGLKGVDPLDFGSAQQHPDYTAGPRANMTGNALTANVYSEQLTYTPSNHNLKFGVGGSQNKGTSIVSSNQIGTFEFAQNNAPFNPAVTATYPTRFRIRLGEMFIPIGTWRMNAFVSDKWQLTRQLTLNLGVRYDYDDNSSNTKDGFAPRLGVAYAPNEKTVLRAGFGKFYEFPPTSIISDLYAGKVISSVFTFDTGEDLSATRGVLPTNPCLLAVAGSAGMAKISPACRAQLVTAQNQLGAGSFINTEPRLYGNRKLGYLYQIDFGVERQIMNGMAVTVDYVGSRGRDQTGLLDINEPRLLANGTIGRPGPAVFDADGTRIPAQARNAAFRRVLEYTTSSVFNSDYDALELSVVKRFANRWSGRLGYTLSRSRDVAAISAGGFGIVNKRVNDDFNPRRDYGLATFDNRHGFTAGGNWNAWRDFGVGAGFRYYSGNPVNETVGTDANRDNDTFDRPLKGRDDLTRPIVSKLDSTGTAIRNGIEGSDKMLLDLRLQYVHRIRGERTAGVFWEIYNALNRVNFANPIGARNSADFLRSITADESRSMQIGLRYTF